jgi:hypothetical protein
VDQNCAQQKDNSDCHKCTLDVSYIVFHCYIYQIAWYVCLESYGKLAYLEIVSSKQSRLHKTSNSM